MTQTKIFAPDCWSGINTSQHQIKVASTGLGKADAKSAEEFMSPETAHFFSKLSLHPDCFYVHKLAMGCSERYGPNRWGDGFSEQALRSDVGTFERHAKAYRQHQSKGPHYGTVKLARYRDSDGIVELITEYYGNAKVAAAIGGEGAREADEEIQELLKHGYFPVSMGSLVPFDVCSTCSHKAPKPKDRCMSKKEGGSCNMFGCLNGMLKMASSGQLQFVHNPHNTFYDISKVKTGADPIANGVLLPVGDFYRDLKSNHKVAEFAFEQIPNIEESPLSRSLFSLAIKLAEMEAQHVGGDSSVYDYGFCKLAAMSQADTADASSVNTAISATALSQALRSGSYVSFERLCKHEGISEGQAQKYAAFLPNLYGRLRVTGQLRHAVARAEKLAHSIENSARKFAAAKVASIDLKQINRASLIAAANEQSFNTLKTAAMHEPLPEVVMKFAAIELCLTHHSPQSDLRAFGLVRRKHYSIPGGN